MLKDEYYTTKKTELEDWEGESGHVGGAFTKGIGFALQKLAMNEEKPVAELVTEAIDLLFKKRKVELYRSSENDAFFKLIKYKPKNEVPKMRSTRKPRRTMVFNEERSQELALSPEARHLREMVGKEL
ncbi:MAG: hypothetical protein ACRBCK_05585 [Alphaproteobacteria bacterium]